MTWKELKEETLRKLFALSGQEYTVDTNSEEYIHMMPQACNEALNLIWTSSKYSIRKYTIVNRPLPNLLKTGYQSFRLVGNSLTFAAHGAKAYYFDAQGEINVTITVGENVTEFTTDDASGFIPYKGLIENADDEDVTFRIATDYPAIVKNVCLYGCAFKDDESVMPYGEYIRVNLKDVVDDFFEVDSGEVYRFDESEPTYMSTDAYFKESRDTIVINSKDEGIFVIYYRAYPPHITKTTDDDYELPVDPEVMAMLPNYMAYQLYKDDDVQIAVTYWNDFDAQREALSNGEPGMRKESFVSESGW